MSSAARGPGTMWIRRRRNARTRTATARGHTSSNCRFALRTNRYASRAQATPTPVLMRATDDDILQMYDVCASVARELITSRDNIVRHVAGLNWGDRLSDEDQLDWDTIRSMYKTNIASYSSSNTIVLQICAGKQGRSYSITLVVALGR